MAHVFFSFREKARSRLILLFKIIAAILVTFFFLTSVNMLSASFKMANEIRPTLVSGIMGRAASPLVGVLVGVFVTSLLQSSSATTSILVGLVAASSGAMPIDVAVPMVMGANIGSTVTNTIVAMGHVTRRIEFRRAIACSTMHDFFNMLSVIILLPLELATGFLQKSGAFLAGLFENVTDFSAPTSPLKRAMAPIVDLAGDLCGGLSGYWGVLAMAAVGIICLFIALYLLTKVLKSIMLGKVETLLGVYLDRHGPIGIAIGAGATAAVQSSAVTISFCVPLSAAGVLKPKQIYPLVLGANLGTTVTALLAALGGNVNGLTLAFAHLLFNICGLLIFYPFPRIRFPIWISNRFSRIVARRRWLAPVYVLSAFYLLPLGLIFLLG